MSIVAALTLHLCKVKHERCRISFSPQAGRRRMIATLAPLSATASREQVT